MLHCLVNLNEILSIKFPSHSGEAISITKDNLHAQ